MLYYVSSLIGHVAYMTSSGDHVFSYVAIVYLFIFSSAIVGRYVLFILLSLYYNLCFSKLLSNLSLKTRPMTARRGQDWKLISL
jgi:hypothetical protein